MGTFDFLAGQPVAPQGYNPQAMQAYSPAWNTGAPQGMDYSQVLGGGQAQPLSATQGLDFSKIGQWALNQAGDSSGGYAQALGALGQASQLAPQGSPQQAPLQPGRGAQRSLGQVQQGSAGYLRTGEAPVMGNMATGLLGRVR